MKATVFEFTSYSFSSEGGSAPGGDPAKKRAVFNYKTEFSDREPLVFTETILLPKAPAAHIPKELLEKLLQSLHIILGISYYKFYCPPAVAFGAKEGATLSKSEAEFWNIVYKKGLGEFFYKNNLDPAISPKFPYAKKPSANSYELAHPTNRCLVGIGGGKDSIVAAELLKQSGFDITAFVVETNKESPLIKNIIEIIGIGDLKIQRFLDWQIHQKHQYNGHIPISAVYAFLGVFAATLYNYSYVIMGNEYSSNFGNIKYKGLQINHQWSKSFEFETLFQNYVKNSISPDIFYFSLLRPFYEIRIVKLFARSKKYFPHFSSCNSNFKTTDQFARMGKSLWCGQCAKCMFGFTLLSAFLSKKDLLEIFDKNLYEDEKLLPLFKDILGLGNAKPFDCVGTFEEAQTALHLAKKNFKNNFIIKTLGSKVKFYKEVFKTQKENHIPEQFKFLGMENVLLLGYGKEGKATQKYLKKYYPKLKIGIADEKNSKNYLEKQNYFDVAIKTPGIKKELVKIPHTTATNIFFSKIHGKNITIGITGSKGKSTTASLIFEILKEASKNVYPIKSAGGGVSQNAKQFNRVEFLGNIGNPMIESLMKPIKKDTIFVLELSSYQLDDVRFSPDIAVVTSLFPEHMDYHNGVTNYYKAKKNIINFQGQNDYFIYNPKNKLMVAWLKNYKGKAIPFSKNVYENNLLGQHNKDNIQVAVSAVKILGISNTIIKKAVKSFKGLPHRLEFVGQFKGINFYDDANAATPEATIMAIKSLKNIGTIFLGGQDRGYDFSQLEKTIKKYKIKNVVLFKDSGKKILKSIKGFNILRTDKMQSAVIFAYKHTKKGNVCLLSCASPSYSLWKNFEEKGDEFKKIVKKYA